MLLLARLQQSRVSEGHEHTAVSTAESEFFFLNALDASGPAGHRLVALLETRRKDQPQDFASVARLIQVAAQLAGEGDHLAAPLGGGSWAGGGSGGGEGDAGRGRQSGRQGRPPPGQADRRSDASPRRKTPGKGDAKKGDVDWKTEPHYKDGRRNLRCVPPHLREKRMREGRCWWCAKKGHRVAECTATEPVFEEAKEKASGH